MCSNDGNVNMNVNHLQMTSGPSGDNGEQFVRDGREYAVAGNRHGHGYGNRWNGPELSQPTYQYNNQVYLPPNLYDQNNRSNIYHPSYQPPFSNYYRKKTKSHTHDYHNQRTNQNYNQNNTSTAHHANHSRANVNETRNTNDSQNRLEQLRQYMSANNDDTNISVNQRQEDGRKPRENKSRQERNSFDSKQKTSQNVNMDMNMPSTSQANLMFANDGQKNENKNGRAQTRNNTNNNYHYKQKPFQKPFQMPFRGKMNEGIVDTGIVGVKDSNVVKKESPKHKRLPFEESNKPTSSGHHANAVASTSNNDDSNLNSTSGIDDIKPPIRGTARFSRPYSNNNNNNNNRRYTGHQERHVTFKNESANEDVKAEGKATSKEFAKKRSNGKIMKVFDNDESQREMLDDQLRKGLYECMVCCEEVRIRDSIWNCDNCFNMFHLKCIRTWANSESSSSSSGSSSSHCWRCPACQNAHTKVPNRYFCFCGKTKDPELNRYLTPHSCGEMCGKARKSSTQSTPRFPCPHKCGLICHPGACPSCEVRVDLTCACGKKSVNVKCGSNDEDIVCDSVCDKLLNCGVHSCQRKCHFGECEKCAQFKIQNCFCGKSKREVKCDINSSKVDKFRCKEKCEKQLSCGNHSCEDDCHPGECAACSLDPNIVTHCPCGKVELDKLSKWKRTSCLKKIPTCENVCDKELKCGAKEEPHKCKSTCHNGPCPTCPSKTIIRCRCGANSQALECSKITEQNFICKKRCNKKLQCKRHKCLNECCDVDEHVCDQVCGRKLKCGVHLCQEPCHFNNCPPCWNISWDELTCHCGSSVLLPPIQCGSKKPECTQKCARSHVCGHPITHTCHDDDSCPPCTHLTTKLCFGNHESRSSVPCYQEGVSCGYPCLKPFICGLHNCQKICHPNDCGKCTLPCIRKRKDCGHMCGAICHLPSMQECPKTVCKTQVKVHCECGRQTEVWPCFKVNETSARLSGKLMAETRMRAGESINVADIIKSANENKFCKLKCDEKCAVLLRNRELAQALDLDHVDFSPDPGPPNYPDYLKEMARDDANFVSTIVDKMAKLVLETKQCKLSFKNYNFPPMNSNQRHVIHELAPFYGCKSHAVDKEPARSVVVKAPVGKCYLPTLSIMEVVKKEEGKHNAVNPSKITLKMCSFDNKDNKDVKPTTTSETKQTTSETIDYFDFHGD